jgi:hypothetical protein
MDSAKTGEKNAAGYLYDFCAGIKDGIDKRLAASADAAGMSEDGSVMARGSNTFALMCLFAEKIIVSDFADMDYLQTLPMSFLINADIAFLPDNALTESERLRLRALDCMPVELFAMEAYGSPKFDALTDRRQPRILFMPSYRKHLLLGENEYNTQFKDSEYAVRIGDLLLDELLLTTAEELNIGIDFAPHEKTYIQLADFEMDESVKVIPPAYPRRALFQTASMVITDTLPAYEAACLRKPVIYFRFDGDGAMPEDGGLFGENVSDFDEMIELVVGYMKNGFSLKENYKKVTDDFFARVDGLSAERIYKRLKN